MAAALLQVKDLKTYFYTRNGLAKAVDGVDFTVEAGSTLAIVGESGSGKSVSMLSLMGLIPRPPGRIEGGVANFKGIDLLSLPPGKLREIRGGEIAMVFQDPMTSLNPYLRISTQLTEAYHAHNRGASGHTARRRAIESLEHVGIADASERIDQYPHQFSGGMRQRVMIAMSLINRPKILIADEPTTALDVTIQAQIFKLLGQLQAELGTAIVLITHDLGVVAGMADRVCVMYAGRVIEEGSVDEIFFNSSHPYTQGLLASTPRIDRAIAELKAIRGLPPDPARLPVGCAFAPRCPKVMDSCRTKVALPVRGYEPGHWARCYWEREHG